MRRSEWLGFILPGLLVLGGGCAVGRNETLPAAMGSAMTAPPAVRRPLVLSRELEDRILALDPERVSGADVAEVLARAPAPRIIKVHGGRPPVYKYMISFSKFLAGMGYPAAMLAGPGDGFSFSGYTSSRKIAGTAAWYYEQGVGLRPMLIGHSLGGMQTVRVLYQLDGRLSASIPVWNPETQQAEPRDEIVDPLTGRRRPVVGLELSYASATASGGLARLLPNQWTMCGRLRRIPNSTVDFTGYHLGFDIMGGDLFGFGPANDYQAIDRAQVRNVELPPFSPHGTLPVSDHLLESREIMDWINDYRPSAKPRLTPKFHSDSSHILWAADIWHDIKKHWVLELQRVIRAQRALNHEP